MSAQPWFAAAKEVLPDTNRRVKISPVFQIVYHIYDLARYDKRWGDLHKVPPLRYSRSTSYASRKKHGTLEQIYGKSKHNYGWGSKI